MVDRNFYKLKNGLSRQGGLSRGGNSRQVSLYVSSRCLYLKLEQEAACLLSNPSYHLVEIVSVANSSELFSV